MKQNSVLYGVHDLEGAHLLPDGGWAISLTALADSPPPVDYRRYPNINIINRIDWGYHGKGTIPLTTPQYDQYLDRLDKFISNSIDITHVIIGNEPNHEQEWPGGVRIPPEQYAGFYLLAQNLIRSHGKGIQVAPAAFAPYHVFGITTWLDYARIVFNQLESANSRPDFLACHSYTRSSNPDDLISTAKMTGPLADTYSGFFSYYDFYRVVPQSWRGLPLHMTEFNEIREDGWEDRNTGVVRSVYEVINRVNKEENFPKLQSLSLFRYAPHDKRWDFSTKQGVLEDFKGAASMGYSSPTISTEPSQDSQEERGEVLTPTYMPSIKNEPEEAPEPPTGFQRNIDPRAVARGVTYGDAALATKSHIWAVTKVIWYDEKQAKGTRNVFVEVLDEQGNRVAGKLVKFDWKSDDIIKVTQGNQGYPYAVDYPLNPSQQNDFAVEVSILDEENDSEIVGGLAMGANTPDGYNPGIHTSYYVTFQLVSREGEEEYHDQQPVASGVYLLHPVLNGNYRDITQLFGANPEGYSRFVVGGVPLQGHNGIDFRTPEGQDVVAVDGGKVVESAFDEKGYGNYIKLQHTWGESLYAHLKRQYVVPGVHVNAGHVLGQSGNSGNSTGPHLHFALRINPYNRSDGMGGYSDPYPYLPGDAKEPVPVEPIVDYKQVIQAIRKVSAETGIDWRLLASLAWAESSFRSHIKDGLFQIGDATWQDFATKSGATDRNNPLDNTRVAANYLKYLSNTLDGNLDKALIAYNFGIGNVLDNVAPPAITLEYVNKVKHGYDLLKALGS